MFTLYKRCKDMLDLYKDFDCHKIDSWMQTSRGILDFGR